MEKKIYLFTMPIKNFHFNNAAIQYPLYIDKCSIIIKTNYTKTAFGILVHLDRFFFVTN